MYLERSLETNRITPPTPIRPPQVVRPGSGPGYSRCTGEEQQYQSGRHVLERHSATDQLTRHDSQTVDVWLHSIAVKILHHRKRQNPETFLMKLNV